MGIVLLIFLCFVIGRTILCHAVEGAHAVLLCLRVQAHASICVGGAISGTRLQTHPVSDESERGKTQDYGDEVQWEIFQVHNVCIFAKHLPKQEPLECTSKVT